MGYTSIRIIFSLLLGSSLFIYLSSYVGLSVLFEKAIEIGSFGVTILSSVYLLNFAADTITWHLTMTAVPITRPWFYRLWVARMIGETYNMVLPAGGIGGEPVKAILMKYYYGLTYHISITSLILTRTVSLIALVFFLSVGFYLALVRPISLPRPLIALVGCSTFVFFVVVITFLSAQQTHIVVRISKWLSRTAIACYAGKVLKEVEKVDQQLAVFYKKNRSRFLWALVSAFSNWFLGTCNLYCTSCLLDMTVKVTDAWIIESLIQVVRTWTFFIPSSVGVQEGMFVLAFTSFDISAHMAMTVALLRRVQEVLWIILGGILSLSYFPYRLFVYRRSD